MPIENVPIHVPIDLAVRIAAGELSREGSVVRDAATKRIVKHLSEVDGDATAAAANRIFAAAKANPSVAFTAGAVALVGVGAAVATVMAVRKRSTPAIIGRFEAALRNYLEEIGQGRISTDVIDELNSAWSATKALPSDVSRSLQESPTLGEAKQVIASFTLALAKANNANVSNLPAVDAADRDLSEYLGVQRRILDAA